jgi:hypothetical protein
MRQAGPGRWAVALALLLASGCTRLFPERIPAPRAPADAQRFAFDLVARNDRFVPEVIAVDREGRAVLVTLRVRAEGRPCAFTIWALGVRRYLKANETAALTVTAERSGIYAFGCTALGAVFGIKGRLAIK